MPGYVDNSNISIVYGFKIKTDGYEDVTSLNGYELAQNIHLETDGTAIAVKGGDLSIPYQTEGEVVVGVPVKLHSALDEEIASNYHTAGSSDLKKNENVMARLLDPGTSKLDVSALLESVETAKEQFTPELEETLRDEIDAYFEHTGNTPTTLPENPDLYLVHSAYVDK